MTITLDTVYSWKSAAEQKHNRAPYSFLGGLSLLSLDACEPFYKHLCLPASFTKDTKQGLQECLRDYSWETVHQNSEKNEKQEAYVVTVFQLLEKKFGLSVVQDIGEWMGASDDYYAENFANDVTHIINNIESGALKVKVLPRVERYWALRELIQDSFGYLWDEALEPVNLKTRWDKAHYEAHNNPDPDEALNTWYPDARAYLGASLMQERIAWENACQDPAPDDAELDAINSWVNTNRASYRSNSKPVDARAMFLSPRLKAEYQKQRLIRR